MHDALTDLARARVRLLPESDQVEVVALFDRVYLDFSSATALEDLRRGGGQADTIDWSAIQKHETDLIESTEQLESALRKVLEAHDQPIRTIPRGWVARLRLRWPGSPDPK